MKNKVLTALLCFLVAFGLWLYVITVVSPGTESTFTDIAVKPVNETSLDDRNLMIIGDVTPTVTLRLSGNRSDLLKLSSDNINVTVDYSKITEPGMAELAYNVTYPGNVPNNAISIQNRNPDYIVVEVAKRVEKTVPVEVVVKQDTIPDGFIPEDPVAEVQSVKISGPEDRVAVIEKAVISIDLTGCTESIHASFPYTLCDGQNNPVDAEYVKTDAEQIMVDLTINRYKIIPLKVNIIAGGGATEKDVTVTYDTDEIMVYGSEEALAELEYLELGTVDLGVLPGDQVITYPIELPEGVTHETGENAVVTVTITFGQLQTKQLTVTDIQLLNIPEGYEVKSYTKSLEVMVRGPKDLLPLMTAGDITAVADVKNITPGTHTWSVTIQIDEKFAVTGSVGIYQIKVGATEVGGAASE